MVALRKAVLSATTERNYWTTQYFTLRENLLIRKKYDLSLSLSQDTLHGSNYNVFASFVNFILMTILCVVLSSLFILDFI